MKKTRVIISAIIGITCGALLGLLLGLAVGAVSFTSSFEGSGGYASFALSMIATPICAVALGITNGKLAKDSWPTKVIATEIILSFLSACLW